MKEFSQGLPSVMKTVCVPWLRYFWAPPTPYRRTVVGVVTDRDICMAAYTQNRSLREIPVSSAMSSEVYSVHPEEDLETAEMIIKERQVHRIPVVDAEGVLVGILSLNDLANAAARPRGLPKSKSEVTHEEIAHTLEAISAHRVPQTASS